MVRRFHKWVVAVERQRRQIVTNENVDDHAVMSRTLAITSLDSSDSTVAGRKATAFRLRRHRERVSVWRVPVVITRAVWDRLKRNWNVKVPLFHPWIVKIGPWRGKAGAEGSESSAIAWLEKELSAGMRGLCTYAATSMIHKKYLL